MFRVIAISSVCLFILFVLAVSVFGSPALTVVNKSPYEIDDIVITGRGFESVCPNLSIEEKCQILLHPEGDSGLKIRFRGDGRHIEKDDLAYIQPTGGYFVRLEIDEALNVENVTYADSKTPLFLRGRSITLERLYSVFD